MKKVFSVLCTAAFLAFTLTGCWDLTEPESISLASVIGITMAPDNQIEMIVQDEMITPSGQQIPKNNWSFEIHKSEGSTLYDAVQNNLKSNPQRVFFSHTKAIIVSEEFVRQQGIKPLLDFLNRNPDIRQNTMLLIVKEGNFEKVLLPDPSENSDTGKLIEQIINTKRNSYVFDSRLKNFLENYWGEYRSPYALGVSASQNYLDGKNVNEGYDNANVNTYNLEIADIAVFRDDKMVGWLSGDKSRGFLFAKGKLTGGTVNIDYHGKPVTLSIDNIKSRIKPEIKNGMMQININIDLDADVAESDADIDIDKKSVTDQVGTMLNEEVKNEINQAVDEAKNLSTDVFEFGSYFFENYPNYWKEHCDNWADNFANLTVNIQVSSNILHIGLTKDPAKISNNINDH